MNSEVSSHFNSEEDSYCSDTFLESPGERYKNMGLNRVKSMNRILESNIVTRGILNIQSPQPNIENLNIQEDSSHIKNLRILCVDDSSYNLFVLKELLLNININIIIDTALNGRMALDKIL